MTKDDDIVWVSIPLDGETAERLRHLSDICHAPETSVAASLLHDILKDDADAHAVVAPSPIHFH